MNSGWIDLIQTRIAENRHLKPLLRLGPLNSFIAPDAGEPGRVRGGAGCWSGGSGMVRLVLEVCQVFAAPAPHDSPR